MKCKYILICALLTLSSCGKQDADLIQNEMIFSGSENEPTDSITGNVEEIDESEYYLCITQTGYNNQLDSTDGMTTQVISYNLGTGEISENGSVPYTSQYPLAVYDRGDNVIYYSADDGTERNLDQLFCHDLSTGNTYQLTENLFAINYIIPTKDKIVLVAAMLSERANTPYIYDKKTGDLNRAQMYKDFSTMWADYNPMTERLFLGGYLESENYKLLNSFNESGKNYEEDVYILADGYVFELMDEYQIAKKILCLERQNIEFGLPSDVHGNLYLSIASSGIMAITNPDTKSFFYSADKNELLKATFFDNLPISISSYTKFKDDYYILGASADGTYPRGIYRYKPDENLELIYCNTGRTFINQFRICKDIGKTSLLLSTENQVVEKDNTNIEDEDSLESQLKDFTLLSIGKDGLVETRLYPELMQPMSAIYFVDDSHFLILAGGMFYETQEQIDKRKQQIRNQAKMAEKEGATYIWQSERPKAGDYIDYLADGAIHRIYSGLTLEEAKGKAEVRGE